MPNRLLFPLYIKFRKCYRELPLYIWGGPRCHGRDLDVPLLAVEPAHIPQRDLLLTVHIVKPQRHGAGAGAARLGERQRGGTAALQNVGAVHVGRQVGDAEVGVGLAAGDRQARLAEVELDAGLDPLGRSGPGPRDA
jgi:hypothetical protein